MAELDGEIAVFNVCSNCGQYSEEKEIDPHGPFAICPYCGYRHRFVRLPLFVITGASASGKTTVCLELATQMRECVFMETDILWRSEFVDPEDNWHDYRNMWLRVAKNISQAGRPVVLCGSARPEQFESCPERRYFTTIHYLAMVCEADELTKRLQSRPRWRASSRPEFIKEMLAFNAWFKQNAASTQPPMDLLDTTELVIQETCRRVQGWISSLLPESDE